ncbi:MAG: hypothetical protein JHC30_07585 [Caldisericum sp.]|nr:hypothetical protein [Caldisericum sp.]
MTEEIVDEYSQNQITYFWRGGRLYFYLRDPKRKTFIKRLNKLYVCYIAVFERCYSGKDRKGKGRTKENDIHVEFVKCEEINVFNNPDAENDIENAKFELEDEAIDCALKYNDFGGNGWDKSQFIFTSQIFFNEVDCENDRCRGVLNEAEGVFKRSSAHRH